MSGPCWDRYTERSRQAIQDAQEQARSLKHNYIGTEHLLLGLCCGEGSLACDVLAFLGISNEVARDKLISITGEGTEAMAGRLPFTPRANRVLNLAPREALCLAHSWVGTEHILLALIREGNGVSARMLAELGVESQSIQDGIFMRLGSKGGK